jgi:hypothetical protein
LLVYEDVNPYEPACNYSCGASLRPNFINSSTLAVICTSAFSFGVRKSTGNPGLDSFEIRDLHLTRCTSKSALLLIRDRNSQSVRNRRWKNAIIRAGVDQTQNTDRVVSVFQIH